jgi:aminoglycoside phosphotransferase (APT) family kinase protein
VTARAKDIRGRARFVLGRELRESGIDSFTGSDEDVLRECLDRVAPRVRSGPASVVEIHCSPFRDRTSYDAYRVRVRFESGDETRIFLKDFGFSLRPKDGAKQRREREIFTYRDLLADADLGTARYYGSVLDEAAGRLWLLLEYVDGTPVGYTDLGNGWAPAAEGLGRMHGHFARQVDRLRGCEFLIRHDAEFLWSTVEQAFRGVAQLAPRTLGRLERLIDRYDPVMAVMTSQPTTLLQGGCRPSNVLIQVASDASRVCILDWEQAALGPPVFDLAHLVDGIDPPLLDRLLDAYRRGAATHGMSLPPDQELKHAVDCFRLHMVLNLLARSVIKGYTEKDMVKLLDYGDRIGRVVFGESCR